MTGKNGAAEWLRGIADKYQSEDGFGCREIVEMLGFCCDEIEMCNKCRVKAMKAIADRIDREMAEYELLKKENAELKAERALPDGMEWPRFEDGELVKVGDTVGNDEPFTAREIAFEPDRWLIKASSRSAFGCFRGAFGERVKRPAPKVLDADGVSIKVGDTVYCGGEDKPLRVSHITDSTKVILVEDNVSYFAVKPSRLTHERPDSWERIEEDAKLAPRDYLEKRGMNPEKTERIASMMADLVRRAKALAKAGEGL